MKLYVFYRTYDKILGYIQKLSFLTNSINFLHIFLFQIRPQALSISMCFLSLLVFVILKLYPYFLFELGIPATMYTSATISVVTIIYLYIFMPETKGKSMDKN